LRNEKEFVSQFSDGCRKMDHESFREARSEQFATTLRKDTEGNSQIYRAIETEINTLKYYSVKTSSSSYVCHGVRPLVDPFRSHVSRSLFRGLPRFLLPFGE